MNVTSAVQLAAGASGSPHVVERTVKFGPTMIGVVLVSVARPLFVSVICFAALIVPTAAVKLCGVVSTLTRGALPRRVILISLGMSVVIVRVPATGSGVTGLAGASSPQ